MRWFAHTRSCFSLSFVRWVRLPTKQPTASANKNWSINQSKSMYSDNYIDRSFVRPFNRWSVYSYVGFVHRYKSTSPILSSQVVWAVHIEGRFVSISRIFFRAIFCISIFSNSFFTLECEAFQIFCPMLNFQSSEMFPVFPDFPVFLGKQKRKNWEKSCSIRIAHSCVTIHKRKLQ